jgi:uroporphyrinogen-III synthase
MIRTMEPQAEPKGLAGLRVVSFESRRAAEMAKLIQNYGGQALVAPSMREVPLESNVVALDFCRRLIADGYDMVIFLTGVGARALTRVAETLYSREDFVAALRSSVIVARGPKPVAALKELGIAVNVTVPEPNTWRDLLHSLDAQRATYPLKDKRVAVQEYGSSNVELLAGLVERGATVTPVPVYQWALPEDTAPLRTAVQALTSGEIDVSLFTTSIQVLNLLQVADEMGLRSETLSALGRTVVGSIGPVTSEELREHGLDPDFEPLHPKMGFLVNEAAKRASQLVKKKRPNAF